MGMDVYGENPTSETGEYFRRNVWGWRPLWSYVEDVHDDLASLVKHGHDNSGDGLRGRKSKELSTRLFNDLETGVAEEYIKSRNERLSTLERPDCWLCKGTGIRTDEIGVSAGQPTKELSDEMKALTGRTHGWCNACDGEGKNDAWETNYYLDLDDIREFAEFLADCGGFQIC